jgi:CubicO group peptidase (beta-lactamase class C family)
VDLQGHNTPEFAEVRRVFAESFSSRGELGASVCVWYQGQVVADLWGGHIDTERRRSWQEDTLCTVFSSTKGLVALCFLVLAERGDFDFDDEVANYWPEFGEGGKDTISIRTLLNHRAGLVAIDEEITLEALRSDVEGVAAILAKQVLYWPAGQDQGYHGVSYGLYAAELFRRISGQSLGAFLAEFITGPLKADAHLGLGSEDEVRVSPIFPATTKEKLLGILPRLFFHRGTEGRVYRQVVLGKETAKAFRNPAELGPRGIDNFNRADVHAMELPWCNGIANARGLARVYAVLANGGELDGVKLVEEGSLLPLRERQSWSEQDRILRKPMGWSQGFIKEEKNMFSPNTESFGHPGAGGALGWCDPMNKLAIGYVPNKMSFHIRSPRARALASAVYRCIE